ncbi:MAG: (2Fe-2S)-binding protein [Pseudomonadota bacterium]
MPIIHFIQPDGTRHSVQGQVGHSVMQVAVDHQVPGILGDCGGSCSCATCHGYVGEAWGDHIPSAEQYETDMLCCALDVLPNSRLTCQIHVTPELDGLQIMLPRSQT